MKPTSLPLRYVGWMTRDVALGLGLIMAGIVALTVFGMSRVEITVTPIEISAGWRFRIRRAPKLIPYAAGGFTILKYQETSDFASGDEDADDSFSGYHLLGGAEYKIKRWLGVAGEASWSTVPDAIGESGVSEAFDETDLGGTTFRVKVTIGR